MQKANGEVEAGMLAVLRLEDETVCALCREFSRVYPVNFNCPGQVAVSGRQRPAGGIQGPRQGGWGQGHAPEGQRRLPLPLPERGGGGLPEGIGRMCHFSARPAPLLQRDGLPYEGDMKDLLARQICSPVLWSKTVLGMIAAGADTFIEVGPGRVLAGLVSRISDRVRVYNVQDKESLSQTISEVEHGA
jgi:[acyl-carrier-protein] S-malonyltransferase